MGNIYSSRGSSILKNASPGTYLEARETLALFHSIYLEYFMKIFQLCEHVINAENGSVINVL